MSRDILRQNETAAAGPPALPAWQEQALAALVASLTPADLARFAEKLGRDDPDEG
jgi:hypothetical protein